MKETSAKQTKDTLHWVRNLFRQAFWPSFTDVKGATPQPGPAPVPTVGFVPTRTRRNKKILLVDDDPLFVKLAGTRLEADGYDIITATDGCEAIRLARREKPDVLVLDVNLPHDVSGVPWDGFRVISWMRRFEGLKEIPVIVASSGDPRRGTRLALAAGGTAFFHKKAEAQHLLTLVDHTLARKSHTATAHCVTDFEV